MLANCNLRVWVDFFLIYKTATKPIIFAVILSLVKTPLTNNLNISYISNCVLKDGKNKHEYCFQNTNHRCAYNIILALRWNTGMWCEEKKNEIKSYQANIFIYNPSFTHLISPTCIVSTPFILILHTFQLKNAIFKLENYQSQYYAMVSGIHTKLIKQSHTHHSPHTNQELSPATLLTHDNVISNCYSCGNTHFPHLICVWTRDLLFILSEEVCIYTHKWCIPIALPILSFGAIHTHTYTLFFFFFSFFKTSFP